LQAEPNRNGPERQPANAGYELINALSFRNPQLLLVQPSEPENSLLYTMLNCTPPDTYPLMPPVVDENTQRMSRPLRARVYDWIAQGARGFDEDGNPYSNVLFRDNYESLRHQRNLAAPPPAPRTASSKPSRASDDSSLLTVGCGSPVESASAWALWIRRRDSAISLIRFTP